MLLDSPLQDIDLLDRRQSYKFFLDWPRLARAGYSLKPKLDLKDASQVVFLGLGGSASAGDIVSDWLNNTDVVNSRVYKGFLPKYDMRGELVLACSVSGSTQETLETTEQALQRGGTVVGIASGGMMEKLARDRGFPFVKLPVNLPARFSFACLLFSILSVLTGVFPGLGTKHVKESMEAIDRAAASDAPGVPLARNASKKLASSIDGKTPVIYGSSFTKGVAVRFKNQLNENAKIHAVAESAPDAFHHDIESWQDPSKQFLPVLLRHSGESTGERDSLDSAREILQSRGFGPVEARGLGGDPLGQLVSLTFRLDFASYYLAILLDRDPFPISLVDQMKSGDRPRG